MKYKDIKTTLIFIFVLLLVGILGFSYAYFEPILSSQGNQNLVVSKDLRLIFDDESISEGEIYPGDTFSKKFTVTNNGTSTLYYEIKWEDYNNTFINDEIHIELNCISYTNYSNESKAVSGTCEGFEDKAVTSDTLKEAIEITGGKTYEYEVILTFIETGSNQDYNKGKIFNSTLEVVENVLLTANLNGGTSNQTLKTAYEKGETVELLESYKSGYVFSNWSVNGRGASIDEDTLVIGDDNTTVTANYITYEEMYTYTGNSSVIDDGNGKWRIKFLTSGTFVYNGYKILTIDVFAVGGGGKGSPYSSSPASAFGGGGGLTTTEKSVVIRKGVSYSIVVGTGATTAGDNTIRGGTSSAFGISALGGQSAAMYNAGDGGSGGSDRGSAGGTDGSNGTAVYTLGYGQGTTTKEFGESTGYIYSNGGSGSSYSGAGDAPRSNSGDGSNGVNGTIYNGADGIVVIRNHYEANTDDAIALINENYTYSGSSIFINDTSGSWRIKFLSSGTFVYNGNDILTMDVFAVGGGGKGSPYSSSPASAFGGGGGLTTTEKSVVIRKGVSYSIVVGTGATTAGDNTIRGGTSSAFGISALGGQSAAMYNAGDGGSGGSDRGSAGGSNGSNGIAVYTLGYGQGTTTKEFGETTGFLYSNGGSGSSYSGAYSVPRNNSGDGSNGVNGIIYNGADGIVVIRNHYAANADDAISLIDDSYTYSGNNIFINDGNGNWRIKFLSSGNFVYTGTKTSTIDVFVVGGGGKASGYSGSAGSAFGAGGGLTTTQMSISMTKDSTYSITVGIGATTGGSNSTRGGTSTAFGVSAIGGQSGAEYNAGDGGSGGSDREYAGGTNGSNGTTVYTLGYGQGTTTKEFAETTGYIYSNGGSGSGYSGACSVPRNNSGDGSNGVYGIIYNGADGIAIIRNHR